MYIVVMLQLDVPLISADSLCACSIQIEHKWVALGWSASTLLGLYSVFGLYDYARTGDISAWWRALYVVAGRPAYALALGWITFACATQNGAQSRILSNIASSTDPPLDCTARSDALETY
ncbi:unnamed protein product [Heligmosomoides polygyrus]|uniref:Transmembrane protein n=1 Tax=Heligmosomoides polygyrus TaxID=6339 RepID=A0A183GKC7_HELPZ|nr:unnamed protein product [Heligmosomoides polygyrus]